MATTFSVKIGEIGPRVYICRLGIPKWNGISQFRFRKFNGDDLSTSCKNLANFGLVTPELKRLKDVHPVVDQQFSYVRLAAPLLDTALISIEFCERSLLSLGSPFRSVVGASLLCRAGYSLGSAAHF